MKNEREIRSLASKVLEIGCVCDSCLGRQFAKAVNAGTNKEKGKIVRNLAGAKPDSANIICIICDGILTDIKSITAKTLKELKKIDFAKFMVGVRMSDSLVMKEEALWEKAGIKYCEPIKVEISREFSKIIAKATGKKPDNDRPDIIITLDVQRREADIFFNPLFIYGMYKKLSRGLPQTSARQFANTVEDIIARPLMKATRGSAHVLHAQGREDKDARCLVWRPFVLEIKQPQKRRIALKKMQAAINRSAKVKVFGLSFSNRKKVAEIKAKNPFKIYRVLVDFEKPVENPGRLKKLKGVIKQRTPSRVLGGKPDRTKDKKVKSIKWKRINSKRYQFDIIAESGLYLHELVSGDGGRTRPSVSQLLENSGKVKEFDLIGLKY